MRRVVYFHHGGAIGGAPLSLLYLLRQIDRSVYAPLVVALRPGPAVDRFRAEGIETHVAQGVWDFSHTTLEWYGGGDLWQLPLRVARYASAVKACRDLLRRLGADLVHLNSSTLAAAARAARQEGIPVVWHIREPIADGYTGLRREWLKARIDHDASRVIAISEYDAARLRPSPRVRVIYNFVDFEVFDRAIDPLEARRELDLPPRHRVVTMLGGVAAAKGTLTLVRAVPLVRRKMPDTVFVVAGRLPAVGGRTRARSLARSLLGVDTYDRKVMAEAQAIDGHLRFVGVRSDMARLLAATDVLVFPATVPHFGRPLIEAAAMVKPVVASRLGPSLELVEDGVTGRLIPPSDPVALSEAILATLGDPAGARRMGEAGYARAREKFDAVVNARRTFDVYREIPT